MGNSTNLSLRGFLKQCVVGGIAIYSAPLLFGSDKFKTYSNSKLLQSDWKGDLVKPKFRFDAIAKVTGEKIYGRDYRSKDVEGWPDQQSYAFIIRVTKANRVFEGIDLSSLSNKMKPSVIITADTLKKDEVNFPPFFGKEMLLAIGKVPDYEGQEVAILIFDDFISYKLAKNNLQFNDKVIKYSNTIHPLTSVSKAPYSTWRIVREEGFLKDKYSPLKDGLIFPNNENNKPVWPKKGDENGDTLQKAIHYSNKLHADIENEDWYVVDKTFTTQSIEPAMLEAEAFNGWFDRKTKTMHLVICSQSPADFYTQAGEMLSHSPLGQAVKNLVVHSPYLGGGFGAKDHTPFPYFGLITLLYSNNPISLANNRFEQFQAGIKRHPFVMKNKLAFDKTTKKIKGLITDTTVDGGGRINFSSSVTMVGLSAMQSIYYIPRNDLLGSVYPSAMPIAGSMRGYGTLQTMASMEMMMNEAALDLKVDPIELRRINVFKAGNKNTQGAIPNGDYRYLEMLNMAEKHSLWKNRHSTKLQYEKENTDKRYGVGFSIATKDYGTGAAAPTSSVEITENGEIIIKLGYVEMGPGTNTSQGALVSKYLGSLADEVILGEVKAFEVMKQVDTDSPYMISQDKQDKMSKNPQWTPVVHMASAASMSAYFQTHTTDICAKLILKYGLYPAAVEIWKTKYFNNAYANANFGDFNSASWTNGKLSADGFPPIDLKTLAKKAHEMGLLTGVMVHAFNRWAWASATFDIAGVEEDLLIDGLALKYGNSSKSKKKEANDFSLVNRKKVIYPKTALNNAMVTYLAPCATLVELSISKKSGEVEILNTHTWLEPGTVLVKDLVEGQIQGGLAMGVGHALYESLPQGEGGAGNGTWNFSSYHLPRAKDVGVWNMNYTLLHPLSKSDPSKGIGEVVMIPVVSSIVEAIHHAIDKRFYHLPVTPADIKKEI
ncbi:MAG: xanthine dehydrogenase family protein molybdopterin-binding subunit [Campylobacteraceae bacterium]|nr:xanthine dehydrogenase family protein molybdopterin-binding subunit [Campylobacteraceae bacterium]